MAEAEIEVQAKVFVGVDWGREHHQVHVTDLAGKDLFKCRCEATSGELCELVARIGALADADEVAIGVECTQGPLVEAFLAAGFQVWGINPSKVDRLRDRYASSGAKDDRRDAEVIARALRTDGPRAFGRVVGLSEDRQMLRDLLHHRVSLVGQHQALGRRIAEQLHRYHPAVLEASRPEDTWFIAFYRAVPTPSSAAGWTLANAQDFIRQHRIRRHKAEDLLEILRSRRPAVCAATERAARRVLDDLVDQLELVDRQVRCVEKDIRTYLDKVSATSRGPREDESLAGPSDVEIALSVPGYGPTVVGLLLTECGGTLLDRGYPALRLLSGVAPVTQMTGKRQTERRGLVRMRKSCNKTLRQALLMAALNAVRHDAHFKEVFAQMRARGLTVFRARRQIADQLLRRLAAMLRTRTLYDPAKVKIPRPAMIAA